MEQLKSSACPGRSELVAFNAGTVSEELLESIAEHLVECSQCLAILDSLHVEETESRSSSSEFGHETGERGEFPTEMLREEEGFREFARFAREFGPTADVPGDVLTGPAYDSVPSDDTMPEKIGRYEVHRLLGSGGFSDVYLATDPQTGQHVAVKVPRRRKIDQHLNVVSFLDEARTVAALEHPGIVPVLDWGMLGEQNAFVTMKYIDGQPLNKILDLGPVTHSFAADIVGRIAEALHYAHRTLVHRDVKPANILLDKQDRPHIADFGLAVLDEQQLFHRNEFAGTRPYMAPEQIRREAHRLDGRTDIWSLGVVLYEMLAGRRPFTGNDEELHEEILQREPKPPRQIDDSIPAELERICLKCLSKRMTDRYPTAHDLAEELRSFRDSLNSTPENQGSGTPVELPAIVPIVPKGLRAFDQSDADFFPQLLPGPRNRDQLPESVRFWKSKLDETDPEQTFPVGVLYGPSGCGKSSLLQAGVIPRLSENVRVIYIQASRDDTEANLMTRLRKLIPSAPRNSTLQELILALRNGDGARNDGVKTVLVIDQFEQWLHAWRSNNQTLIQSLRQCDGGRVQCLLLVRDDFWLAVSRFMHELEVRIVEGENSAVVDLFDREHACKVLADLGRAYNRLPPLPDRVNSTPNKALAEPTAPGGVNSASNELNPEQQAFIEQAVDALAENDRLICVRLVVFAEMMKRKTWSPANLKQMGGIEGVGVSFLDETFASPTSPPEHRLYEKAARAVLTRLLPEPGADIKGHTVPLSELREASGSASAREFERLIDILDAQTRLLTPVDQEQLPNPIEALGNEHSGDSNPGDSNSGDSNSDNEPSREPNEPEYQLTHDFLVSSLRAWLTSRQRETRQGRAQLQLADRAKLWTARPEQKQLPSVAETVRILAFTKRSGWNETERATMTEAIRHNGRRVLGVSLIVMAGILVTFFAWQQRSEKKRTENTLRLVAQLFIAGLDRVPAILQQLEPNRDLWEEQVTAVADNPEREPPERLRAHLALAGTDAQRVDYIVDAVPNVIRDDLPHLYTPLRKHRKQSIARLWVNIQQLDAPSLAHLRLAGVLAEFDSNSQNQWESVADDVVAALVRQGFGAGEWTRMLQPADKYLTPPLLSVFLDSEARQSDRVLAAEALAIFGSPDQCSRWLVDADSEQFRALFARVQEDSTKSARVLDKILAGTVKDSDGDDVDASIEQRARAGIALIALGKGGKVWPSLQMTSDPTLRTELISRMASYETPAEILFAQLEREPDSSIREALLIALAEYREILDSPLGKRIVNYASSQYQSAEESEIHSSSAWLLNQWKQDAPKIVASTLPSQDYNWWVNNQGLTMIAIKRPGEFQLGSPKNEQDRDPDNIEGPTNTSIDYPFAIGAHEVTVDQFKAFSAAADYATEISRDPQSPINRITWVEAARYCRWLSEQEEIPESQMVYPEIDKIGPDLIVPPEKLLLSGYRLPLAAEWEYAARGGAGTRWCFGEDPAHLPEYAWYLFSSGEHTWPVGTRRPNSYGLFHVHGNLKEWCQDTIDLGTTDEILKGSNGQDVVHGNKEARGGYYRSMTRLTRSAKRFSYPSDTKISVMGFRVARTMPVE